MPTTFTEPADGDLAAVADLNQYAAPVNALERWREAEDKETTPVGNVGGGEDTLLTTTIPAAAMSVDGQWADVEACLEFAANGNNKTAKLKYGATTLYDSGAVAQNGGCLVLRGRIYRTGATTQRWHLTAIPSTGGALVVTAGSGTAAETLSGAVNLVVTGESAAGADGDVSARSLAVTWRPA